ncbi:MAG TPA: hypothetical protein VNC22_03150 [Sporichthya sp.]|nr:hypothetical protein [Sporichthya sp.]
MSGEELPVVTLARIEGKLDLINSSLARHDARGDDHENRLRALEATTVDTTRVAAVEARTLVLEARPEGITPAKFLTTLVGCGSLAAALSAVVTLLTR